MTIYLGYRPAGSIVYVPFHTFNGSGASVTISGLAVTDIEIYKNGSATQRSSDAGYTLLDTDGIDFDGLTGIHGFSIDTSDNTDSGFFAAGSHYWVVVSAITVDSQTVSFVAATFDLGPVAANVTQYGGSAGTFSGGRPEVNVNSLAANSVTASALATDAVTEIQSGLATAAALTTVDTVVDAIQAKTDQLTFTSGNVDANIEMVIADQITASSSKETNWGGTP